ncbi:MAG: cysteine hydrolase [Lachnospiraceae bacterium]|nr:cysteine hydrolase [Lachnospiraceae bacterium]
MKQVLLVIDMQKDFIDGALGTKEAEAVVPAVLAKIRAYDIADVFVTMDLHEEDYLDTQEGKFLPVRHCIRGTEGQQMPSELEEALRGATVFEKGGFGSVELMQKLTELSGQEELSIEIVGLCTDVCVVTHALMMKAAMPSVPVSVDASCCAGITPEGHRDAIATMRACQIIIKEGESA